MCNFLSGLTFSPKLEGWYGRFYSDPAHTDHHLEMESALKLTDRHDDPHWAKWEFTPSVKIDDFDSYLFRLDEERKPEWWNDEIQAETVEFAKQQLATVILSTGSHEVKEGRVWLTGDAHAVLRGSSSAVLWGSSSAVLWGSSSAELRESSSAELRESSSAELRGCSSAVLWGCSSVVLWGSSSAELWGSSSAELRESSRAELRESSRAVLQESSSAELRGCSSAVLWESSSAELRESSSAVLQESSSAELWGSSRAVLRGYSRAVLWGYATGIRYSGLVKISEYGAIVDRSGPAPTLLVAGVNEIDPERTPGEGRSTQDEGGFVCGTADVPRYEG